MANDGTATFAELLQYHRLAQGLTQEELAEKARLSARAISDLERGVKTHPRIATIRQLAEGLGLSAQDQARFAKAARRSPSPRGPTPPPGVRTFLFADLRGYTAYTAEYGDEAAALVVARFNALVDEAISARDGEVVEHHGDGVLAVFVSARNALRAALDLQQRLAAVSPDELPLGVGIGLDAGEAVPVDGGYRGSALNLAARLCGRAGSGEVLASESVIHLAGTVEGISYSRLGTVPIKGFAEPLAVVQVLVPGASTDALSPPTPVSEDAAGDRADYKQKLPFGGFLGSLPPGPLIAHDEEVAMLLAAVEGAAAGEGRLVLLAGEAGIGKTRLAQETTRVVHERGFIVAAGRCYEPQRSIPYYPFLEALGTAFAAAPPALHRDAARRWPYLARLLPDELGASDGSTSSSAEEQDRLFRAVAGFVGAVAETRPLALLIDDLHWADSASLQLLHHLARTARGRAVLLLGTYRDSEVDPQHPLEATLLDLSREGLMERVPLRRLGALETATFISRTMGPVQAEAEFASLVYRHTDGNPFFTQQILQCLVDTGALYRDDGGWKRREIREIEVPESIRSVITQRASRLDAPALEILQEASVLGPAFSFDDLVAMKEPSSHDPDLEDALDGALTAASTLGLVRVTSKTDYVFDHALTQGALYASLSPRRRRRLHLLAGGALEALPERKRNGRAAELAWHFLQADDVEKAARYALLAGDVAASVLAHGEAERQYRTALELANELDHPTWETDTVEKLGVVMRTVGRYDEASDLLERAARRYRESGDSEREGQVVAQIGILCWLRGAPQQGVNRLRPLVEELESIGPSRSLALLYAALVRLFNLLDNQAEQMNATERLLALAPDLDDDRLLAEAEVHRGAALMRIGRYDEALRLLESAIPRAESVADLNTVCIALGFAALVYYAWHDGARAFAYHKRAVDVAERLGDPREISHRAVEAAYHAFLVGDWSSSRQYAERSLIAAMELDTLRSFMQPLYTLAELSLYTGGWEDAKGYLQESTIIAEHLHLADYLREVEALRAERDLLGGDPHAAFARLRPLRDTPGWDEHPNFLVSLAAAAVADGDTGTAQDAVAKAVDLATRMRLPLILTETHRVQGIIARERGSWQEADHHFEQAERLARDTIFPWADARALYEHALLAAGTGEHGRARELFATAGAIFRRLGAEPYLARVESALATLEEGRLAHAPDREPMPPPPPR